ncbi:MAG: hypothetical protein DME25_15710 [Verrucomicrobia bacterium]|nr:MAG: hypothetical protein DME25_15710 [Verrucomicrobiota bacterium]
MKTTRTVLVSGVIFVALAGLALSEDKPAQSVPAKPAAAQKVRAPAPETKATQSAELPGEKGTVYSVKTKDGKVLYEDIPTDQLRAKAPELHEFLNGAVAGTSAVGSDGKARPNQDARILLLDVR